MLLPVGRTFDVLDVAEQAGRRALVRLERMGLPLGPVAVTPTGRAQFFVAPGPPPNCPACSTAWAGTTRTWTCGRWAGAHITAPPSDLGGLGPVRWLRPRCWTRPPLPAGAAAAGDAGVHLPPVVSRRQEYRDGGRAAGSSWEPPPVRRTE